MMAAEEQQGIDSFNSSTEDRRDLELLLADLADAVQRRQPLGADALLSESRPNLGESSNS